MVVKRVMVAKGVTVSVGRFESVRIDAQVEFELEKGEDEDSVFEAAFEVVDSQVNKQLKEVQDIAGESSVFKSEPAKPQPASRKRQ